MNQLSLLETLATFSKRCQKTIINEAKRQTILAIIEICRNISTGTFNYSKSDKISLKRYSNRIKKLAKREKLSKQFIIEKKLINYRGNIGFLSKVIAIAIKNLRIPQVEKPKSSFDIFKLKCHILQLQSYLNDISNEIEVYKSDDLNSSMSFLQQHDEIENGFNL